jgi:hypothetical protein
VLLCLVNTEHGGVTVVIKEQTRRLGYAINVSAGLDRDVNESSRQELEGVKTHRPQIAIFGVPLACGFSGNNREELQPKALGRIQ